MKRWAEHIFDASFPLFWSHRDRAHILQACLASNPIGPCLPTSSWKKGGPSCMERRGLVRWSVRWVRRRSVGWSVGRSVGRAAGRKMGGGGGSEVGGLRLGRQDQRREKALFSLPLPPPLSPHRTVAARRKRKEEEERRHGKSPVIPKVCFAADAPFYHLPLY